MTKPQRLTMISLLLGGFLFLLSAFNYWTQELAGLAATFAVLGLINLLAVVWTHRHVWSIQAAIHVLNLMGAVLVGYQYQTRGSEYIHLIWYLAAFSFLSAALMALRRRKSAAD
jgi:hypothetical protein